MFKFRKTLFLAALCFVFAASFLAGQSRQTGAIEGQVADADGAFLPGAGITVTSPNLMGTRSVVTDDSGHFRIPALPTGTYAVEVTLQGFAPIKKTGLALHAGTTVTVDITLEVAKLSQEVVVIGTAPLIDVRDSALAKTFLTKDILENIPTAQNTYSIINMAPGVADQSAYGAANSSGNSYQVDGVELVDAWFGGGIYTAPIDYNVIEESQIVGLGAPAEYGNFTGAMVNIITKSGGNAFSGDAQLLYRGKTWQSENIGKDDPKWSLLGEAPISALMDGSLHVGGPIIKDKLWFFAGGEYWKQDTEMKSMSKKNPITYPKAFVKLTFQPSEKDRFQLFGEYHSRTSKHAIMGPLVTDEANQDLMYPVWVGNMSYLHTFSQATIFELKVAGYTMSWDSIPSSRDRNKAGHYDLATGAMTENLYFWSHWLSRRLGVTAALSHSVENFIHGSHDFKFGFEYERSSGGGNYDFNGPDKVVYYDFNGAPYLALKTKFEQWAVNARYSFYAQDDWRISDTLVINPGLRFNIYRGSIPALNKTVYKPTNIEPRLGFVWDLFRDHNTVLKAHIGRYNESSKTYYFANMTPMADSTYYSVLPNWAGISELYTIPGTDLYSIDPDIKHPSMDQLVAGVERVLGKDLSVSLSFIYRKWRNFIEPIDLTSVYATETFTDPDTGKTWTIYNQTNAGEDKYYITNPRAGKDYGAATPNIVSVSPERKYAGLEISLTKRFSDNWQLFASYVYSKEDGTYSNAHTATQSMNMGMSTVFSDPNNQINLKGKSVISPPHIFKVQGTYLFPLGFSMSAFYSFYSGQTWTRAISLQVSQYGSYLLAEPMGSRRMPNVSTLDVRLEKSLSYRNFKLSLMVDLFNALNQSRETSVQELVNSNFGKPLSVNAPRTFRFGARIMF